MNMKAIKDINKYSPELLEIYLMCEAKKNASIKQNFFRRAGKSIFSELWNNYIKNKIVRKSEKDAIKITFNEGRR